MIQFDFYISNAVGDLVLEGHADSYQAMVITARTMQLTWPNSSIEFWNHYTGAVVVFIAETPNVAYYMRYIKATEEMELLGVDYFTADAKVWRFLTLDGTFDPHGLVIDFLGDPLKLAAVTLPWTDNTLAN